MKKQLTSIMLGLALFSSGCSTIAPGEDSVLVRAEQLQETAYIVMDTYLQYANANRHRLSLKEVDVANKIQTWGKSWLRNLDQSLKEYKETGDEGYYQLGLGYMAKINDLIMEIKAAEKERG